MHYIDQEGMTYSYPHLLPSFNVTKDWIDDRLFKKSPHVFKAPARWPEWKVKWGYLKKEVRFWYRANLRDTVEKYLRQLKFTYFVDMDPLDFDNQVFFGQKTDRQILFILAGIMYILEFVYDAVAAQVCPAPKKKKKSIISSSKDDVKGNKKSEGSAKKERREKIE